jgi:hypothetical protein
MDTGFPAIHPVSILKACCCYHFDNMHHMHPGGLRFLAGAENVVYYVSSLPPDPVVFGSSVRAHWGIENSLHYVLDVAFGEDACRIKSGNAPENMAFIRKIALSLARSDTGSTRSMAGRIKQMAWSEAYLEHLLFQSGFTGQMEPSVTVP